MLNTLRNILVKLMLVFSMPALIAQPIESPPFAQSRAAEQVLSYDEIIELINKVESGELEQRDSDKEHCQVNKILALLARAGGVFDEDEEQCFQNTIASLLDTPTDGSNFQFQIDDLPDLICDISSINSLEPFNYKINGTQICDTFLLNDFDQCLYTPCGWVGNAWKKTKKFLAKYKTEIIIGAAVVVAAVIIFSTMGTATAPVAALTSATQIKTEPNVPAVEEIEYKIPLFTGKEEAYLFPKESSQQLDFTLHQYPINVEYFRNQIKNDLHTQLSSSETLNDSSLMKTVREHGSAFTHECLTDIVKECDFIAELGAVIQKHSNQNDSLLVTYNNIVDSLHEKVDVMFSTNMASLYNYEARKNDPLNDCLIGIMPSPGAIIKCGNFLTKSRKNLFAKAGKVFDRGGYTIAGRSLMKKDIELVAYIQNQWEQLKK